MHIDQRDLSALDEIVARAGLDELVLRRDGEEIVVRARPLVLPGITLREAVTFRWPDGDWIVEAHVEIANPTDKPLRVLASSFGISGNYAPWPPASTLGNLVLAPGARQSGIFAWFTSRALPAPTSASFHWSPDGGRNVGWTATRDVRVDSTRSAATPQLPTNVAGPPTVPAGLVVAFGSGEVFRWTDGDWIERVVVRVTNDSAVSATFPRAALGAALDGRPLFAWPPAAELGELETIGPGETFEKKAAWYCSGSLPQPERILVVCGPPDARLAEQTVTLTPTTNR